MALQLLRFDTPNLSANELKSIIATDEGPMPAIQSYENYLGGIAGGQYSADIDAYVGAVQAYGLLTVSTGGSSNGETCTILNVTFTAVTSGATGNQFNISATAATQAANMVTAINASANLAGKVTATSSLGVVTITSWLPGLLGNGLQLSAGNLTNVVATAFANGTDGTTVTIDMS